MPEIIFRDKQLRILLLLRDKSRDWYISTLAKSSGTTYVHACNFILQCESRGLTTSDRHGKIKVVKLTDKGALLSDILNNAKDIIASASNGVQQQPEVRTPPHVTPK
jgi:predicted transcriptional regulator